MTPAKKYICPICNKKEIESFATGIRPCVDFGVQIESVPITGCQHCVRLALLECASECALSGWKRSAYVLNPFFIVYNVIRAELVLKRPERIAKRINREVALHQEWQQLRGMAKVRAELLSFGYTILRVRPQKFSS